MTVFQQFFALRGTRPTGLFGYNLLRGSDGFKRMADDALTRSNRIVAKVLAAESDQELIKTIKRLDKLSDILCSVIDSAQLIQLVHPESLIRDDAMQSFKKLSTYLNSLNTNRQLYLKLSLLLKRKELTITPNERIVGELLLHDFKKSGIHMSSKDKEEYIQLHDKILDLGNRFMNYGSDASIVLATKELPGLKFKQEFVQVTANSHLAHLILHKSTNEDSRRKVFMMMNQGTSLQIQVLEELLKSRSDLASLLNEKSYAHMFLKDKMLKSPEHIYGFLTSMAAKHLPTAKNAVDRLRTLKAKELQPWDVNYFNQFIPVTREKALMGLDMVFESLNFLFYNLFGITFEPGPVEPGEVWHADVFKLNVVDSSHGKIGSIYCDLFEREDPESLKFEHPAHFTVRCSRKIFDEEESDLSYSNEDEVKYFKDPKTGTKQKYQLPIVVLVTSFKRPKNWTDLPKLHLREIETVFHEMGHAIHSMMARTDFQHVSGTRVPVDFVEVPSIFIETFASKLTFSKSGPYIDLSRETAPTNAEIIETQNQIQLSILDLEYHSLASDQFPINSTNMLANIQSKFHCLPYIPGTAWQVQFSHLYSYGSYYYSYLWSKRLSSRIHKKLLTKHVQEWRQVGEELNSELFGLGGSRDPWIGLKKLGIVMDGEQEGNYKNSKYE